VSTSRKKAIKVENLTGREYLLKPTSGYIHGEKQIQRKSDVWVLDHKKP
jgi:hypothetical protein